MNHRVFKIPTLLLLLIILLSIGCVLLTQASAKGSKTAPKSKSKRFATFQLECSSEKTERNSRRVNGSSKAKNVNRQKPNKSKKSGVTKKLASKKKTKSSTGKKKKVTPGNSQKKSVKASDKRAKQISSRKNVSTRKKKQQTTSSAPQAPAAPAPAPAPATTKPSTTKNVAPEKEEISELKKASTTPQPAPKSSTADKGAKQQQQQQEEEQQDDEPVPVIEVKGQKQIDQFKSFTMEVLKKTLNDICQQNEAIVVFGVSIAKCSIDWSKSNLILTGLMNMFDGKLNGHVKVEIIDAGKNNKDFYLSIELSEKHSFQISNLLPSLKGTTLDNIKFRNPKIIIVTTEKNSFDAKPGITFKADISPGSTGQNQYIQSMSSFIGKDAFFTAQLELSGNSDIGDLKNAATRKYTLSLSVNEFRAGTDRVQCSKASIALSNEKPALKIDADCNLKLKGNSEANIELVFEANTATTFGVGGSVKGQVTDAFHVKGLTLTKGGVSGVFEKASLTELKFEGEITLKGKQFTVSGDVFKGEYSFGLSSIGIRELLNWLQIGKSVTNKVPDVTMKNVELTLQTATNDADPSFKIQGDLNGRIVNFNVAARSSLEVDKEHVSINGALSETSFKVGPVTLSNPELGIVVKRTQPGQSVYISGKVSLWSMKNLITKAEFFQENGKSGYSLSVKLEKTFKVSQISSALKNTPLKALHFKDPELKYSSSPVKYIDNVSRSGAVFVAKIGLDDMPQMMGVNILFGGKLKELPVVLPFGGSGLSIGAPQNLEMVAILPFGIPVKSKYIQFLAPLSMTIGLGTPASFGLNCDLIIRLPVDKQPLHFRISFRLNPVGADASAETMNEWRHPFGLKGLVVKKLGLDIGIIYKKFAVTGIPSRLGVIGEFKFPGVGDVKVATLADIGKGQFILSASIDRFGIESLRQLLASLGLKIPKKFAPPAIEFRDIRVYMAPNAGRIGSVQFQPGYNLEGKLFLFKQNFAQVRVVVSFNKGIIAEGKVSAKRIGPLNIKESSIDLQITPSKQHLIINTQISLKVVFELVNKAVKITVDKNKMIFHVENMIYKLVATASTQNPSDFTVEGTIKMVILNGIKKALEKGINGIKAGLNKLKSGMNHAKKAFNTLKNKLKKFKLPNMCPRPKVATVATLSYGVDEHNVMFRRFRRAFRRAGRSMKKGVSRAAKKAAEAKKRAAAAAKKAAQEAKKRAAAAAKKAAQEAKKRALQLCNAAQKGFKALASKVKSASSKVQQATKKYASKAAKYTTKILTGKLFALHSISFKASLASVNRNRKISVSVDITIVGKRRKLSYSLPSLSKVKELPKKLLSKITKR